MKIQVLLNITGCLLIGVDITKALAVSILSAKKKKKQDEAFGICELRTWRQQAVPKSLFTFPNLQSVVSPKTQLFE